MMKIKKWLFGTIVFVVTVFFAFIGIIQLMAEDEVKEFLRKKIPSHIDLKYSNMSVNVLAGSVNIKDVMIELYNRDSALSHTTVKARDFKLKGLDYWGFFMNNTISTDDLLIVEPQIVYYRQNKIPKTDSVSQGVVSLLKTIEIDRLTIRDGKLSIYNSDLDSVGLRSGDINFTLIHGKTDPEIIKNRIPLTYDGYTFSADSTYVNLGSYEDLSVGPLTVSDKSINIENIALRSKYEKNEMANMLSKERDYVDLQIPRIGINTIDFGFDANRFFIKADSISIPEPQLEMYRDKTLGDDKTIQKLYSTYLRELPIDLAIPTISITNASLGYEERINRDGRAGRIQFDAIDASIVNLSNRTEKAKKTKLTASGDLMGTSHMSFEYSFDVKDKNDNFLASGSLRNLNAKSVNSFLRPNLGVEAEGTISEMYFTISGNALASQGDMKMKYHDFKFAVLGKDKLKINKLLTAIGNLFVNDGSKTDAQGYRYGQIDVEREHHKSFFNYMWINMRDGILSTLTGNGKKE